MTKFKALTNFDIANYMKNENRFKGTFYKDNLHKINENESIIVNLDNSTTGLGGTHFTCLYNNGDHYYYFDSFGVQPPKYVIKMAGNKRIIWNDSQFQHINSDLCGFYCMYVLKELYINRSFYDIIYSMNLNNQLKNEKMIRNYFK